MPSPPSLVYPVSPSYVLIGRESAPATVATTFAGVKCGALGPMNKPTWLKDNALWGDMAELHDLQQGPRWAELTIPESPLYGDTFGHFLYNLFGDYTATGTAGTPTWTTSATTAVGATSLTVSSGSSAVSGTYVQIDTGVNAEICTVGTGSTSTSVVLNSATPTRFSHASSVAVTTVTAPFTHNFALLNTGGTEAYPTSAQPPSHTLIHVNPPAGSGGYYEDQFLYGCLSELTVTAKSNGWLTWSAKITAYCQTAPASQLTGTLSTVKGIPAWKSTTSEASSAVNQIAMWTGTWSRKLGIIPTADGAQSPYFIGRGQMTSSFKMTISPAIDETSANRHAVEHPADSGMDDQQWPVLVVSGFPDGKLAARGVSGGRS